MKFLSKIRRFLKIRKKLKKLNKFVENGDSKETNQIDIKNDKYQNRSLYDYNSISRYENIDEYRIKISPKIQYHFQGEDICNEISKELENIKSKHKNKNHSF